MDMETEKQTQTQLNARLGRNPFAPKTPTSAAKNSAPKTETSTNFTSDSQSESHEESQAGSSQVPWWVEKPVHVMIWGLKTALVAREIAREIKADAVSRLTRRG